MVATSTVLYLYPDFISFISLEPAWQQVPSVRASFPSYLLSIDQRQACCLFLAMSWYLQSSRTVILSDTFNAYLPARDFHNLLIFGQGLCSSVSSRPAIEGTLPLFVVPLDLPPMRFCRSLVASKATLPWHVTNFSSWIMHPRARSAHYFLLAAQGLTLALAFKLSSEILLSGTVSLRMPLFFFAGRFVTLPALRVVHPLQVGRYVILSHSLWICRPPKIITVSILL